MIIIVDEAEMKRVALSLPVDNSLTPCMTHIEFASNVISHAFYTLHAG